jgi:hypothetical protein
VGAAAPSPPAAGALTALPQMPPDLFRFAPKEPQGIVPVFCSGFTASGRLRAP